MHTWTKSNNTRLNLQINNTLLDMHTHPKILGFILDPKLTCNKHIDNTAAKVSKSLPLLKVFCSKETLHSTYKAVILEYAFITNIRKLQTIQNIHYAMQMAAHLTSIG